MQDRNRSQRGARPPGQSPGPGRRSLTPAESLPAWKAALQVLVLLGIPVSLLFIARIILRTYFPHLGY
jgi:hypothetical protein